MSTDQIVARMETIQTRMETLGGKHRMTQTEGAEFAALRREFAELAERADRARRAGALVAGAASGQYRAEPGTYQGGLTPVDSGSLRDATTRTLDRAVAGGRLAPEGAELVDRITRTGSPLAQTWTQRWAAATGAEAYERAFCKKLADPDNGHLTWTPEEAEAWRTAAMVQSESRAMSTTDANGGFLIPFTLDPAVIITSNGSTNPLRQIARVVQTVSDSWNGVTSAGVTAEWLAEAAEAADASPTLAQPSIPVHKASAFVPYSFEVGGDGANFLGELSRLLLDAYDQLTATAYTTGSGSGQPTGVITKLVASAGSVPLVAPGVAETITAADVYAVQNALPPRFQPNAVWNAPLAILNTLRGLETTNGAHRFPALHDSPATLLGRQVFENSGMDGTINTAATESNYPLLYGDFSQFAILDRLGSTIELVPHLFGANQRPTGQRGALLWARTGSDVLVPNAFRLLSVPTSGS